MWQDHHRTVHTVRDMVRDHRATGGTVIGETARLGCFPTQHGFLAGIDVGQTTATKRTCRGVKVDVMLHLAVGWIAQGQLDHVAFVANDQGAGNRAVVSQRPHRGTGVLIHNHQTLGGLHCDLDDLGATGGDLFMLWRIRRGDEVLFDAGIARQISRFGRCILGLLACSFVQLGRGCVGLGHVRAARRCHCAHSCAGHGGGTRQHGSPQNIAAAGFQGRD